MSEIFVDRSPMQTYGPSFVDDDLRMCLEGAMHVALDGAVQKGWYTTEEADAEYEVWHHQFD